MYHVSEIHIISYWRLVNREVRRGHLDTVHPLTLMWGVLIMLHSRRLCTHVIVDCLEVGVSSNKIFDQPRKVGLGLRGALVCSIRV